MTRSEVVRRAQHDHSLFLTLSWEKSYINRTSYMALHETPGSPPPATGHSVSLSKDLAKLREAAQLTKQLRQLQKTSQTMTHSLKVDPSSIFYAIGMRMRHTILPSTSSRLVTRCQKMSQDVTGHSVFCLHSFTPL